MGTRPLLPPCSPVLRTLRVAPNSKCPPYLLENDGFVQQPNGNIQGLDAILGDASDGGSLEIGQSRCSECPRGKDSARGGLALEG